MPVSRATHETLKTAHAALKVKYQQAVKEQAAGRRTDEVTAATITRLTTEASALRRIVAAHIRGLEQDGWGEMAAALRERLAAEHLDLTSELASGWRPGEGAVPAKRTYTSSESRLLADLHRQREVSGAFEAQCLGLQRANESLTAELQDVRLGVAS
jgi:hypothetical protein